MPVWYGVTILTKNTENVVWNKRTCPSWDNNWSPLHFAARIGKESLVQILVEEFGAYIDVKQTFGAWTGTPLHAAILGNHPDLVSKLLSYGADVRLSGVHSGTETFNSALNYAEILKESQIETGAIIQMLEENMNKGSLLSLYYNIFFFA